MIVLGTGRNPLTADLPTLVGTCAVIQGQRRSGKSYLARVICEQAIKSRLQTIIFDPEGEYITLREKCDILIAGKGRDVPCEARSAKMLARRIAEIGISTVLDMSSLDALAQQDFVAAFLTALDRLPKRLEASRLVVIDEAHKFCPESGKGKSRATEAVTLLLSQGRKRGLGAILVTQRLSKLRKDAAAEAASFFIGCTSPIDLARAQDLLGVTAAEREALRDLPSGDFFANGGALSVRGVVRFHCREALTTHPEPGERYKVTPVPPKKAVATLIAELADLPPDAEQEEAQSLAAARSRIAELERKLAQPRGEPAGAVQAARAAGERAASEWWREQLDVGLMPFVRRLQAETDVITRTVEKLLSSSPTPAATSTATAAAGVEKFMSEASPPPASATAPARRSRDEPRGSVEQGAKAGASARPGGKFSAMLCALATHGRLSPGQLALLVGMSASGGGFRNYLGRGRSLGLWDGPADALELTPAGQGAAAEEGSRPLPAPGQALLDFWCGHSALTGKARNMLRAIGEAGDAGITVEDLAARVDMAPTGGGFRNYLQTLRKLELVSRTIPIVAAPGLRTGGSR